VERSLQAKIKSRREGGADYGYSYAPLDEVLAAVRDALAENGLAVMQFPFPVPSRGLVLVRTFITHESGQFVRNDFVMPCPGNATPQEFGAVITYARRYALQPILGISPDSDTDGQGPPPVARQPAVPAQRKSQQAQPQPAPAERPTAPVAAPTAARPHVGHIVSSVESRGGGLLVRLDTGFQAGTRDAEIAKQLKAYEKMGAVLDLTTQAPAQPGYAHTIVEVTVVTGGARG
jgi:hypothetical protein